MGGSANRYKYLDENGDTATYTFAGTKIMGRLSIDPKALFKSDLFGKEDLKIYAEAAILGLKNYPACVNADSMTGAYENDIWFANVNGDTFNIATRYDDIMKRIPIMFGINFPTFKLLDVFSFEAEWYGSVYANDMTQYIRDGYPLPICPRNSPWQSYGYEDSTKDNWKWSIYAKKTLANHFFIVAQIASDHLRWDYSADYGKQSGLLTEALTQPRHNYWIIKLGYSF
jgi:hypothetical protein